MSKRISKRIALEWTRDLWLWLARNHGRDKQSWPGWETRSACRFSCPCCEHATHKLRDCNRCPLKGHWGTPNPSAQYEPCTDNFDSPFMIWWQHRGYSGPKSVRLAAQAARRIVIAAQKELAKLPVEE
jgi:hypothetical protein